jgi:hypothetical protein
MWYIEIMDTARHCISNYDFRHSDGTAQEHAALSSKFKVGDDAAVILGNGLVVDGGRSST